MAVDTMEFCGALIGVSWLSLSLAINLASSTESKWRGRWRTAQRIVGLVTIVMVTLALLGHVWWMAEGASYTDAYSANIAFVQSFLSAKHRQGPHTVFISVNDNDLTGEMASRLIRQHPGLTIRSVKELRHPDQTTTSGEPRPDVLRVKTNSFPAWRVVRVTYQAEGCWGARDYFYVGGAWRVIGESLASGCP